jgi:hypothetical protein
MTTEAAGMIIKAGTLLTLEHGEYSDRGWDGPFTVKRDFDQAEVSTIFREQWKPKPNSYVNSPSEYDFIAWLTTAGYVEDAPKTFSWYIGSYGFDPIISPST